jgi:hypothetical protein
MIKERRKIRKCGYVVDGEACMKFAQWTPGNSEHFCQNIFNCGNDKLIHATQGMIEWWHTTMVSLLMHHPVFSKKK